MTIKRSDTQFILILYNIGPVFLILSGWNKWFTITHFLRLGALPVNASRGQCRYMEDSHIKQTILCFTAVIRKNVKICIHVQAVHWSLFKVSVTSEINISIFLFTWKLLHLYLIKHTSRNEYTDSEIDIFVCWPRESKIYLFFNKINWINKCKYFYEHNLTHWSPQHLEAEVLWGRPDL